MPIVQQSAFASYSQLLALPAPRIAGLLPATIPLRPQDLPTFTFSDPRLGDLPSDERERLFSAAHTLLDVALGHLDGAMSDHALNTALALFRRAVTGQPMRPATPAQYNAEKDVILLEWMAECNHRGVLHHE